jgi:predicted secreted protein
MVIKGKSFCFMLTLWVLSAAGLWAGDVAAFVDLGFSPDGKIYMFAQYGVQAGNLRPWADLYVVDVPQNNFVTGGRISYTHDRPVVAGQDGSGALYHLLSRNAALADRYGVNFLHQGQPLYLSLDEDHPALPETIEFRDFEQGFTYRATLISTVEGRGEGLRSSFYINVERTARDGSRKSYVLGTPELQRPRIESYRIRKVVVAPQDGSVIFVIEMKKPVEGGHDLRYMVEALRF